MPIRLTRAVEFQAHHRLWDQRASDQANRARFGPTADPHPHRYRCEVTVTGPVDGPAPMVIDLRLLDRILADEVVTPFAGKALHDEPAFRGVLPTCEGLAREIFGRVERRLPAGVRLARVMVAENAMLHAECLGDP